MRRPQRAARARILVSALLVTALLRWEAGAAPRNVIIFIGDGMGFEQARAGGMFANGAEGTLSFESLPRQGEVTTRSASRAVTDSAAAATAIATGVKVSNGVISLARPGDGAELETLLEYWQARGKSAGLVTTTPITHATPAAFGAHEPSRDNAIEVAADYLYRSRPRVLLGGGGNGMSPAAAAAAGYQVVQDLIGLLEVDPGAPLVSGQFGAGNLPWEYDGLGALPHLSEMTDAALRILETDPDGFFLVVEGGLIDQACHSNDIARAVHEVVEFGEAVQVALDWAAGRADTLILVTADHETGGLSVLASNGAGAYPSVRWTTTGHTAANVPAWGWGINSEKLGGLMDNTGFVSIVVTPSVALASPAAGAVLPGTAVSFTVTADDDHGLAEAVLYLAPSGAPLQPVESRGLSGKVATVTFSAVTLEPGTSHAWNCLVTNAVGERSWAPATFALSTAAGIAPPAAP